MKCSFERQKSVTITNALQNIAKDSNCKSYKTWVDKGSEFYQRSSLKPWLQNNDIQNYSTHYELKLLVAENSLKQRITPYKNI